MEFNNQFFEDLGRSPGVTALVKAKAEEIAAAARVTAPVDSGDYKNSITVEVKQQQRSVAVVVAKDPKALLIEAKTGNLVRALNKAKRRG